MMDEKSLMGLFSNLIPDDFENSLGLTGKSAGEQDNLLIESLKAIAGQAGGPVEEEVNAFLGGKGRLLDTTRAAVVRGGSSAVGEVAAFLTHSFGLSAPVSKVIATFLVRLFPAIGQLSGAVSTGKPKPRPQAKPKPSSSAKPAAGHKPKPKPAATHKPKPKPAASAKPAASHKPRPSSSAKPAASHKPKKPKRTTEIPLDEEN